MKSLHNGVTPNKSHPVRRDSVAALLAVAGALAVLAVRRAARFDLAGPLDKLIATPSDGAAAPTRQPHRRPPCNRRLDAHPSGDPPALPASPALCRLARFD